MRHKISKQVQKLMENLINTVELAEEAPDFIANAVQDLFDEYADEKLEMAAKAIEKADGGKAAARVRKLIRNSPRRQIAEELGKQFLIRSK
jgi:hypothetical protein